jgi:hypothetical protein
MKEIRVNFTNLETNGDFWVLDDNPYYGPYHLWTNGKAMTGEKFESGISKKLTPSVYALDIVEYDALTSKRNRGGEYGEEQRVRPKKEEYTKGSYTRYFIKKSSDRGAPIFEVHSDTIGKLKRGYYKNISLSWKLTGPIEDRFDLNDNLIVSGVGDTNKRTVKKMNVEMLGLKWKLSDYFQYYRPE